MINDMPLVSVLCVSMNHAKYVGQSFTSVVNQTYRNIEILYIDNNSSDDSFEIADNIFKNSGLTYQGFKREKSYGLSANLNLLIAFAKGKYITAQSGDDWWELNNIEEKVQYYEQHPEFGMVYGSGYKYFYDTCKTVPINKKHFKSGWVLKDLLKMNFINTIGFVIKKSTLIDVGLFDENSLIEDWDMWIRVAEKYPIGYLDKQLIYYGHRTGNNVSANIEFMDKGAEYIFNKYAHHKEIVGAKKKYKLYRVYQIASEKPNLKNLLFILKNFQLNFIYFKQIFKFLVNYFKIKKGHK
ncbi:MAG: glycosyltransferase family A protein [Ferruginibacter sp.]